MDLSKILRGTTKTAQILKQAATRRSSKLDDDRVLTKLANTRAAGLKKAK